MTGRSTRLSMRRVTGRQAATPLLVLFGLNVVDELDRTAFGVLLPEIRDHFGLGNQGILGVVTVVFLLAYGMQPIVGYWADRYARTRIAIGGAMAWGTFSLLTGLAPVLIVLVLARCGSALGRIVNDPTHNSLLADYYAPDVRPKVYGFHRAANSVGQIIGPLSAGIIAYYAGWRVPFVVLAIPTMVLAVIAMRTLREPVRGGQEREAMGADEELRATEEAPPSLAEGWRICSQVRTLRRIWMSLPFLAAALFGLSLLTSIFYEEVFGLNEAQRGAIAAASEPFQLVGILIGIPIASKLFARDVGLVFKFLAVAGAITALMICGLALAPTVPIAIGFNIAASSVLGILGPGIFAALSMVIPPRARSLGFSIGSLYVLPGVLVLVLIGGVADDSGIRAGMLILVPLFLTGSLILASAGSFVNADIAKVRASTMAQAESLAARRRGESKLLVVKELDAGYDGVQVLFGVDLEIDEGEIVALLGTNGAGKSTLLRAISGLLPASAGAVVFDGRDTTFATPQEVAAQGIIQVPGGKGVFPGLTVSENLAIAGWLYQRDKDHVARATDEVLDMFPVLRERWEQPAGNLSGGEQQMLTLGQAFIARPRLLMIDELSLGLAPVIVEQLLEVVRQLRARGTTIILVEQSVNVALSVAETAYFMEKGQVRFRGPTAELLDRPDVLRSVFLEGAGAMGPGARPAPDGARRNGPTAGTGAAAATTNGDRGSGAVAGTRGPRGSIGDASEANSALDNIDGSSPNDRDRGGGGRPLLEAVDLSRSYGGIAAVRDVSLSLRSGEILGIIGPNGAGKTTVFDLLSGFVAPDAGRICLHGVDVTGRGPDARARLGMGRSFQDARLFPALTVVDTVKLALERQVANRDPVAAALNLPVVLESERAVAERADQLIELMGIGAFADKFVSELSTGSRRVVDLACVLAHEPEVILFDEPSSGIAQREAEALGPLLRRIRDVTGAGLVVIEHDMPLITSISDRMLALDLGAVVVEGAPEEVINDEAVVRSYLGTNESVIARSGAVATEPRARRTPLRARRN